MRHLRGRENMGNKKTTRTSLVAVFFLCTVLPVSALQCFSCADCSAGGAISAQKQQCPPEEAYCATVTRQHVGSWGYPSSSVFRGCASSLNVACELDAELPTAAVPSSNTSRHPRHHPSQEGNSNSGASGNPRDGSSQQQPLCCTKDLCNGSEDAPGWQRRSEEHLRVLTEGNPRRREGYFSGFSAIAPASGHGSGTGTAGVMDGGNVGDEDDNSAKSARGGSRVATVLVIVGTFSQVFWLLSRLIE